MTPLSPQKMKKCSLSLPKRNRGTFLACNRAINMTIVHAIVQPPAYILSFLQKNYSEVQAKEQTETEGDGS